MISTSLVLALLTVHFIADFVLQTDWQAKNKWTNPIALSRHVLTYGACFLPFGLTYALFTMGIHGCVDAVTSKATHWLWEEKKVHQFFEVIGLDQLIHVFSLILLWQFLHP